MDVNALDVLLLNNSEKVVFLKKEGEDLLCFGVDSLGQVDASCIKRIKASDIKKRLSPIDLPIFEKAMRADILDRVRLYFRTVYQSKEAFVKGESFVRYAGRVFDDMEGAMLADAMLDFWLTSGRYDKEFSNKLSDFLGGARVLTCNSGSSANLIAMSALTSYKLGENRLLPGDEVITVSAGFPTTVAPIVQNGLVPVFVDVELGSYNVDTALIEKAISDKTKAIFLAHTLGIPFDLDKVLQIAEAYNLWVIEDNCDSLGAYYELERGYRLVNGKDTKKAGLTGTFGHISTFSFYPAHHITTGEGGAVCTDNEQLYRIMLSIRDWGRDCWCEPGQDNSCKARFSQQLGDLPKGYDHKYTYSHLGYNLKMTDLQAAIGCAQMEKLPMFIEKRRENWDYLFNRFKVFADYFILPKFPKGGRPSPFGFVLTVKENAPFTRTELVRYLEERKVQTRAVFAGNIIRQPAFTENDYEYRIGSKLANTDMVMNNTFWIGVYPGMQRDMLDYIVEVVGEFVSAYKA